MLISRRCYNEPYSLDMALSIIRAEQGRQVDPNVCRAFFDSLDEVLGSGRSPSVD